ncbi:MAG TPA: hypothetical protein VER17_01020 [Tepidisphaeraceae bacterium]|nr:hypothetical protein [Tepidisphaeraceae bacterium]
MIFAVIIILLFGGIAYFHYAQGFFSATLSAVCAAAAATVALGYHESVVLGLLGGAAGDYANAMVLMGLFAGGYLLLRTLMDKMVPGQISIPHTLDKVGGGIVGLIAATFATGIVALGAQMMPFGPSIAGYARYKVETREEVTIPAAAGGSRQRTASVQDQLTEATFTAENKKPLLLPVDDMVVSFVSGVSAGALSGKQKLADVHPNYTDELFAQRLGVQVGAKRVALNLPGKTPQVTVPDKAGVFRVDADLTKAAVDAELDNVHDRPVKPTKGASDVQLVVRVLFTKDAADPDGNVRLSTGSVRLVGGGKSYHPVGTLEGGKLWANKLDDYLIIATKTEDRGADFVFFVDEPSAILSGNAKDPEQKVQDGVFLEVKRLATVDLSGQPVTTAIPRSAKPIRVERKTEVLKRNGAPPAPKPGESGGGDAAPGGGAASSAAGLPFTYARADVSKKLFSPVNTGSPDKDLKNQTIQSGTLSTQSSQFTQLDITPVQSLTILRQGANSVDELFEPAGKKLLQIGGAPQPEGGDPWAWGQLSKWQVVDAAGKSYPPSGGFAKVRKEQADRMVAVYNANGTPKEIPSDEGRPTEFWVAFLVPSGTHVKEVKFSGKTVSPLDQQVQ